MSARIPRTVQLSADAQSSIITLLDLEAYQGDAVSLVIEVALSRLLEHELELADFIRREDELLTARKRMPRSIAQILEDL